MRTHQFGYTASIGCKGDFNNRVSYRLCRRLNSGTDLPWCEYHNVTSLFLEIVITGNLLLENHSCCINERNHDAYCLPVNRKMLAELNGQSERLLFYQTRFGIQSEPPQKKKRMEISISPCSKRQKNDNDVILSIETQRLISLNLLK